MPTISAGNTAEIYCPLASSITFTPGSGGTMKLGFAVVSGSAAIAPQTISAATSITVSAGATVFAQAVGVDATYTPPAGVDTALQALVSQAGILVGQTGVPMILPSGGIIGNNGALSGITALPTAYSTGCFMYFPASAIFAGSLNGLYYVVMSSSTAGTIYNNTYVSGQPEIPTSPTPFVTTGPGAYVQATSQIDLITFPVPASAMGKNGRLVIRGRASSNNNANSKSPRVAFGAMQLVNNSTAGQLGGEFYGQVQNRGMTNAQVAPAGSFNTMGLTTNAATRGTEDTTAVVNVVFGCTVPTAGDYVMWECAAVECIKLA